jgi:hypothetical protein
MDQRETDQFVSLVKKIVADQCPEELWNFETESPALVARLKAGKDIRKTKASRLNFEFGSSIVASLQFIGLLWGTYKIIKDVKSEFRQKEVKTPDLRERWTRVLIESGVAENKAREVADKFCEDLSAVLKAGQ